MLPQSCTSIAAPHAHRPTNTEVHSGGRRFTHRGRGRQTGSTHSVQAEGCNYSTSTFARCAARCFIGINSKESTRGSVDTMNPPPPPTSTALIARDGSAAAAHTAASSSSNFPFASTPWSPSTRGWLVPTVEQERVESLLEDRSQALALATNRAANTLTLHPSSTSRRQHRIVARAPPRVLEEEEYLAGMEAIIRRDFYPAIDAMARRIDQPTPLIAMRGSQLATPASEMGTPAMMATPTGLMRGGSFEDETPRHEGQTSPSSRLEPGQSSSSTALQLHASAAASSSVAALGAPVEPALLHPHELRLGSYLELHTSEDNASFAAINERRREAIRERYWWATPKADAKVNDQRLVLVESDRERSGNIDAWKHKSKNELFFYPDHGGLSERTVDERDTPAEALKRAVAQKSASIDYENTRFPGRLYNPFPGANRSSEDRAADDTTAAAAKATKGTPAVGGYKMVRTPTPAVGGPGNASPLITWGQVVGTPAHLDAEDMHDTYGLNAHDLPPGGESPFRVALPSTRDKVAWGLVDAARRKKDKTKKRKRLDATPVPIGHATPSTAATPSSASAMPPPSPARTPVMMSPAAQRLMAKAIRAREGGGSSSSLRVPSTAGVDAQLRASYTPSPSRLQHARPAASSAANRGARPPVPLFAATPSPMHTPMRAK